MKGAFYKSLDEEFENTAAFRWMCEKGPEYGFILRYPREKKALQAMTMNHGILDMLE